MFDTYGGNQQGVTGAIDPYTGRPYAFNGQGTSLNGGLGTWQYGDQIQQVGDQGSPGGANSRMFNGAFNYTPEFLQSIGFSGDPYSYGEGENAGAAQGDNPAFTQFLQDRGLRLASSLTGPENDQWAVGRAFDAQGNPVGAETRWRADVNPDAFLGAILAGAGFAGSAVAGAGAAGAGEAGSTGIGGGGITAEQAAYGALENGAAYGGGFGNSLVASSEAGFGGALGETGATALGDYGAGLTGAGGAGTSLTTAAGVPGYTVGASGEALGGLGAAAGSGGSGYLGALNTALGTEFTGSQVLGAAGSLANGLIGSYSASQAANAQRDATNSANNLQRDIFNTTRNDWAPYRATGYAGLAGMNNLLANPNSITSDPGYAFQRDQGQAQLDRSAAARGMLGSGAQIKATTRYGQDYASSALDRALSRYGNAAQIGASGVSGSAASGANYANQVGANTTGLGNALAGNSLYQGANWANALNSGIAQLNGSTYGRD